jgi:transcriptional regulator with XRE-family HTH domain
MKQASKYREALGITQEEAAQLLKIPKSILGMFEIGQRDLPSVIKLQLITLYNLVLDREKATDVSKQNTLSKKEIILVVQEALLENKFNLQVLERKIEQTQNKFQKYCKQIQLVQILESNFNTKEKPSQDYIEVLKRKAERGMQKNSLLEQTKLQLKLKGLKSFQKELEKELKMQ